MRKLSALPSLKETRQHGTFTFPCAFYTADWRHNPSDAPFQVKHHWHEEFEIIHFEKGSLYEAEIDMHSYSSSEEAFFFINSGQLHSLRIEGKYEEQALVFSPSIISFDSPDDSAQTKVIRPLMDHELFFPEMITAEHPVFPEILSEFQHIRQTFLCKSGNFADQINVQQTTSQLRIKASLLNILAGLSDHHLLERSSPVYNQKIETLKVVITYIQKNYQDRIYIADLARLVNMNEQYFCRFFKKSLGKTPISYINDLRIRHAIALLQETDMSVMDICMECGFCNLGHFMNKFKNTTELTPLQFRKQYQKIT